jgi:hypothetical protein
MARDGQQELTRSFGYNVTNPPLKSISTQAN